MTVFEQVNRYVKIRNVHLDKKSKEEATKIVKRKYKLTGRPIKDLDQFVFFILSGSRPDAHSKKLRIMVNESEWLNRNPAYPKRLIGPSSIDITRYEILSGAQVAYKIIASNNGFKYVAQLPEPEFQRLQRKLLQLRYTRKPTSLEAKRLMAKALDVTAPKIMRKLGI